MAISYVGERVSSNTANGVSTTEVLTLASSCSAGNTVILCFAARDTSTVGISVADSRGNTWTVDKIANPNNNMAFVASTRQDVGTLVTSDTITITFGTAPSSGRMAVVEEFSGLVTASYSDGTNTNSTAGATTVNAGQVITTNANDLIVAVYCVANVTTTTDFAYNATGTAGTYLTFTTNLLNTTSGTTKNLLMCYQILSATGTQESDVSWTASGSNSATGVTATYKASATTAKRQKLLSVLGIG